MRDYNDIKNNNNAEVNALLHILKIGNIDIEIGDVKSAREVIRELKEKTNKNK